MVGESYLAQVLIDNEAIETDLAEVRNPAETSEVIGYVAEAGLREVEAAIESAERASSRWGALSVRDRGAFLNSAIEEWDDSLTDRAMLLTREQGKVLWESIADCQGPSRITKHFVESAADVLSPTVTQDARGTSIKRQLPFGVTSVIVPWNYPVYLSFQHVIPALICGNTVVVKLPTNAPLSLHWALKILASKLPNGVLNVVPGAGSTVGSALASHPKVRKVLFTGSLDVGRTVLTAAAPTVKSVGLELGGNDPAVVLADFSLSDEAIVELVKGVYTCSGQICFNIKRIYVPEELLERFVERFSDAVGAIRVGNGLNRNSDIGPINNQKEFTRLLSLVADVKNSGAIVRELGIKIDPDSWGNGYFMLPHIVTNIDLNHELVVEEQFGPIVPIIGYDDLDTLIHQINQSEFGLGASIWTDDIDRAFEVGSKISAGTVFVNTHRMGASDMTMPFGGTKQSGLGRTKGSEILLECTEPQVVIQRNTSEGFPGPELLTKFFPEC